VFYIIVELRNTIYGARLPMPFVV